MKTLIDIITDDKFLHRVFIGSCVLAIASTLLMLSFGILAVWLNLSKEVIMDACVTWYLSLIMFFITGAVSSSGKHVKIIAKDHPWYESVGHIIGWERTFDGTPFCEVELTEPYGHKVAIFNGKDLKYI